jgi:regulator of sirC expression with transglutaminase-like and TPR domain
MNSENKDKELNALISLIDEPNNEVYNTIRDKIFSYGMNAIPALESMWENSFDHLIQQRIEEIIHSIQFEGIFTEIKHWKENHQHDLLKGYMLVTKYQFPDLDENKIIKEIGRITQDVWLELNQDLTGLEKVKVINHILFDIYNFSGNRTNPGSPDNFYLKNLLETKKGSPMSLGLIYLIVSQSLKIPIYGVNLPKHFIIGYSDRLVEFRDKDPGTEALFYINPFNKGTVFTRNEIELFVKQMHLSNNPKYFAPCDNVTIIKRLTEELAIAYDLNGNKDKAEEMRTLRNALN